MEVSHSQNDNKQFNYHSILLVYHWAKSMLLFD